MNQVTETKRVSRNLKNLFLDPNNYRFIDQDRHQMVDDEKVKENRIQQRTTQFIEGHKQQNIADLLSSFKANGFLDVDVIQVRDLGDNSYLVLEGNRRVAALKRLQMEYEQGFDIGNLSPDIFKRVPFEIHENEANEKHLIIMGLKHITGNKKWGTYNQDKLIYDFLAPYNQQADRSDFYHKEDELIASLGLTKQRIRTRFRVFNLMLAYKQSEFGDQFSTDIYAVFEEIVRKPVIKDWIGWDDNRFTATNHANLNRLFSWLSIVSERADYDESEDEYIEQEPIITKSREIRDLALFIHNDKALDVMEQTGSITQGLFASGAEDKANYEQALAKLDNNVQTLARYKDLVANGDIERVHLAIDLLKQLIPKQSQISIELGIYSTAFELGNVEHFSQINVESYKGLKQFKLDKLNRINIFAGLNNCGKTSLLEAVYLLTRQNDFSSFFNLLQLKNKTSQLNTAWLAKVFDQPIEISGEFNGVNTSVSLTKFDATTIDKKDDYLASFKMTAQIEQQTTNSVVHTFINSPLIRESEPVRRLCHCTIKSPYFHDFNTILAEHNKTVEFKTEQGQSALNLVVDFVKKVDSQINGINLTEDSGIRRFIVDSQQFETKDVDITSYGEGVQRIFYIALGFAASRNGVVCIDEFETAIHYSLLVDFSKFIQDLAVQFNVQVFITTHSKECVDAFLANDYRTDDITGFRLENDGVNITKKVARGERFKHLVDSINLDIRGEQHD